ncbi:SNF2 domain-containing protein CLASSY 3 [Spatholobus suberectus]|nr:SNF2 domain-containing protein CLASSY 3 [Spatholobus suberectus]
MVQSLLKVVLSGTLYQNHVREMLNILNLVWPKFLKMETSRLIVRRIHSRVHIPGVRGFYDLVENTSQKDTDFKKKVAVIRDLHEMTSKACGEGISLVGASRIIILDVHLNPLVTHRAIGRAFRLGQKKKVFVYRLASADSPEEEDDSTCFKKELISKMWFE